MATVAEEEYLERIYWLMEAELPITGANIARAMQVSAPTVHEMVGRLSKDGFITRRSDKSLEFTEEGRERAASDAEGVTLESADGRHTVTRSVAETVAVRADPSPPPRTALPEQLVLAK